MLYLDTLYKQLDSMAEGFMAALPTLCIALIVVFLTWVAAKFAVRITDRITGKASIREDLRQLLETVVRLVIWLFGLLIALTIAVPSFTPAGAFAGLGVGALAIGFAFQDIFENFLAGVLIMLRDKMNINDVIECQGIQGRVEKINLRETHIRQASNELTVVPNSMLFKNPVKIITDQHLRRSEFVLPVQPTHNLNEVRGLILKVVESSPHVSRSRPVTVSAQAFTTAAVEFQVQWWTDAASRDPALTKTEIMIAVKDALERAAPDIFRKADESSASEPATA